MLADRLAGRSHSQPIGTNREGRATRLTDAWIWILNSRLSWSKSSALFITRMPSIGSDRMNESLSLPPCFKRASVFARANSQLDWQIRALFGRRELVK